MAELSDHTSTNSTLRFRAEVLALGGILLAGMLLRIYKFHTWSLEGDELNTLRDSLTIRTLLGPKPLLFFLNYHLLGSWTSLNEITLRIFPLLFGIASILAVYGFARRSLGAPTALIAAALVAIHPGQLYWSQYARYYTLAFLLTVVATWASYLAATENRVRWYVVALCAWALGWFAHPSTALVAAAVALWVLWQFYGRWQSRHGSRSMSFKIAFVLTVFLFVLAASLLWLPMLRDWYALEQKWGYDWVHVFLGHIDAVAPSMFLCGLAGISLLYFNHDRSLAVLLASALLIPLLALLVLCNVVPVTQGYLFVSTFAFPIGTAYFAVRLVGSAPSWSVQPLAGVVILLLVVLDLAPKLWSHYCDGGRPDFRAASRFLAEHAQAEDLILADQPQTVRYYLPEKEITSFLRRPDRLNKLQQELRETAPRARLWILSEIKYRGGFNDKDLGPATRWVRENGLLTASFFKPRLDYKHNEMRVYLVRPQPQPEFSTTSFPAE